MFIAWAVDRAEEERHHVEGSVRSFLDALVRDGRRIARFDDSISKEPADD
jgi:hypothetical protein